MVVKIYLSLGSNIEPQRTHLNRGLSALQKNGFSISRISPPFVNPPELPPDSPDEWFKIFWNLVIEGYFLGTPQELLSLTQKIEQEVNPSLKVHNAPRCLDIDILWWENEILQLPHLTIPHPKALKRNFILSPMTHLRPEWKPPGSSQTILELNRSLLPHLPAVMAIVNLTPDSFSDGGTHLQMEELKSFFQKAIDAGVAFLDLGAESTRPQATPISNEEEWQRLKPALMLLNDLLEPLSCRPWISVDTYHPSTLLSASEWFLDLANDVTGFQSKTYRDTVRQLNLPTVVMHNLGIPPCSSTIIPSHPNPTEQLYHWWEHILETCDKESIPSHKIYFDPGIGFGKSPHQSLQILKNFSEFEKIKQNILIGHSRKSFFKLFNNNRLAHQREGETIGTSLALMNKPVEVLRVHDFEAQLHAQNVYNVLNASF